MALKIGVDFDNTIISYRQLFHELAVAQAWVPQTPSLSKEQVKAVLLKQDGNDLRWQSLQAKAYGPEIFRATLFEGFREFLKNAASEGHEIVIVSQKSEASHYDPSVKLREWALKWLDEQKLKGIALDNIFFEATREEKLARIGALKLDLFIDDLAEVLEHPAFPPATAAIWFTQEEAASASQRHVACANWQDVARFVEVAALISPEAAVTCYRSLGSLPVSARQLKGGNNQIFCTTGQNGRSVAVKRYFRRRADEHDRCRAEFQALQLLWRSGVRNVAEPVFFDQASRFALHSFIDGRLLTPAKVTGAHVNEAADFLIGLWVVARAQKDDAGIGPGADSRRCLQDYVDILRSRQARIVAGCASAPLGSAVLGFMQKRFEPLLEQALEKFYSGVAKSGLRLEQPLAPGERTLSPSDFGFHNALLDRDGRFTFIDFEYFGWDDPAKMLADCFHTVAVPIAWHLKWQLLKRFSQSLPNPAGFLARWELVIDLIGLEWLLIVLNITDPDAMARKLFANPKLDPTELMQARLDQARKMADSIDGLRGQGKYLTIPEELAF